MDGSSKDNIIIFPKTIEYYHLQLTRLLESERYAEAIKLLRFLLQCRSGDQQVQEEWQSLLDWLMESFPEHADAENQDELTETDIQRISIKEKSEDQQYTKKLLEMLLENPSMDKKILALEQLAFVEQPQINMTLKRWLESVDLHPIVQFKVLQTLKIRGMKDRVKVEKLNETLELPVQETPLGLQDYPQAIVMVYEKVKEVSEINHPALAYFAEHAWKEFLAVIYGTHDYLELSRLENTEIAVWAAALHYVVTDTMLGDASDSESLKAYGLNDSDWSDWDQAVRKIKFYM